MHPILRAAGNPWRLMVGGAAVLLNRPRANEFMTQAHVDALIATSPINVTYLTDYYVWLDPLMLEYMARPGASSATAPPFAVLPLDGDPALVVSPIFAANAADLWVRDLYCFGDPGIDLTFHPRAETEPEKRMRRVLSSAGSFPTAVDALTAAIKDRGLTEGRLGIELDGLPTPVRDRIRQALPAAELLDCSNLLRLLRAVKSEDEINRLRRAAEISEVAVMEALQAAGPGVLMSDLIGRYRAAIAQMGADFDHFAYAPRGMGIATEPDYELTSDDVMYVDFGCKHRYVCSDSGTTLVVDEWTKELERLFLFVRDSMDAGIRALRPGVRSSTVQREMQEAMAERGVSISYPHGHSLGLAIRDYPILTPATGLPIRDDVIDVSSDLALEPNMVINLEAPILMFGLGSVHVEQTFLISERGAEPLISQERSRPVRPERQPAER
jgi:Xaa-Pro aminopeptidase